MPFLNFCHNVVSVFSKSIEFGYVLGKFVVKGGELGFCYRPELALEYRGLSGKLLRMIILRECDVDLELVTDAVPDYLILKSGDKGVRAECERTVLGLSALKGCAVAESLEVNIYGVAALGRAVGNAYFTGVAPLNY